jgi:hypothetical protein
VAVAGIPAVGMVAVVSDSYTAVARRLAVAGTGSDSVALPLLSCLICLPFFSPWFFIFFLLLGQLVVRDFIRVPFFLRFQLTIPDFEVYKLVEDCSHLGVVLEFPFLSFNLYSPFAIELSNIKHY